MRILLLSLMGVCSTAFGAEAVIMGQGRVLANPDYVELGIQVESKCYSHPAEARKANDEAARKIVDFLNTKINKINKENNHNKVISLGGYTSAYQQYYQDKIVCPNTFQKTNNITFRTQEVENFELLFNEIQSQVYALFSAEPRGMMESSITYVTLSSPIPNVSDQKTAELEQQAMSMALDNARSKLKALFGVEKIQNLKLRQVSEWAPEKSIPYAQAPMAMMSGARAEKSASAPVQFDREWVSKTLYFTFGFDDLALEK